MIKGKKLNQKEVNKLTLENMNQKEFYFELENKPKGMYWMDGQKELYWCSIEKCMNIFVYGRKIMSIKSLMLLDGFKVYEFMQIK